MNDITIIDEKTSVELFVANGCDHIINKIREEVKSKTYDISTESGRKEIASVAFKVAKSKTAIDKAGKQLGEEFRTKINAINAERKRAWDELELLQEEVRAPLTEWENRDKTRIAAHQQNIDHIGGLTLLNGDESSDIIQQRIDSLKHWHNYDWEEFSARAKQSQDSTLLTLRSRLDATIKKEQERAELEAYRIAETVRKQKEHEDRIATEAAEKAKKEAEGLAKEAAVAAEIERKRIEQEKQEAEERAAKAESDRVAMEQKAKADAETAEANRVAALTKAEEEKRLVAIEAERAAKAREEAAAQKERDRQAEVMARESAEKAKREADKAHKAKINNEALGAIAGVIVDSIVNSTEASRMIVEAIAKGQIPHVKIVY